MACVYFIDGRQLNEDQFKDLLKSNYQRFGNPTVSEMPFKKTYTDLAMKRALKYAAENGYDYLAWNTGEQVNKRFGLTDVISAAHLSKDKEAGKYRLVLEDNRGDELFDYRGSGKLVTPEELKEIVGSGLSKKLIEGADANFGKPWPKGQDSNPEFYSLNGIDLDMGGEPMKKYYGSVKEGRIGDIGKVAEKIASKYDKSAKVAPVTITENDQNYYANDNKAFVSGMAIPITAQMKEAMAEQGLPLMQVETTPLQKAIADLKEEYNKHKTIGIMPNQNDPLGMTMLAKTIKVVKEAFKQGLVNLVEIAKQIGEGSLDMVRKAAILAKNMVKLERGSLVLDVFNLSTTEGFVKALNAANLMSSSNSHEFRENLDALAATTKDADVLKALQALKEMSYLNYPSTKQFVSQVADYKDMEQLIVRRNGVMQFIYNDKNPGQLTGKHFSMSGRIKSVLNELGIPVRETAKIRRALGAYFIDAKYVKTRSLFEIFTAIHEAMHHLDQTSGLAERILSDKNKEVINDLMGIYQEFYANAKPTHPKRLQIVEGLAVLMNEYLADPLDMQDRYPNAVAAVISVGGIYNSPLITQLMGKMEDIMEGVKGVDPRYRTGLRLADLNAELKKVGSQKQHVQFMPLMSDVGLRRFAALQLDTGSMWKEFDRLEDLSYGDKSLDIAYFNNSQASSIANAWLTGNQSVAIFDGKGGFRHERNASVADVVTALKSIAKAHDWSEEHTRELFNQYLINRRAKGDYNRMVDAKNALDMYIASLDPDEEITKIQQKIIDRLTKEFTKWRDIVNNDNFDIRDVNLGLRAFEKIFTAPTEIYDRINRNLLELSVNTGLISREKFNEYSKFKDYASFQRYIYDDLINGTSSNTGNGGQLTQFKNRRGSSKYTFIGSLEAMIGQIPRTIQKGYENVFWTNFADYVKTYGQMTGITKAQLNQEFLRVDASPRMINGVPDFSHLKNKGYIEFSVNGSKQYYEAENWIHALASTMRPEIHTELYVKILLAASDIFGQMTTSANPFFTLPNLAIDQISTLINTKTGKWLPVLGEAIEVAKEWKALGRMLGLKIGDVKDFERLEKFLALGGDKITLRGQFGKEETLGDLINRAVPKKNASYYAKMAIKKPLNILSAPVNAAEIFTRFGEFSRAIDRGDSELVAFYKAAHVSAPFHQRGYYGGNSGRIAYRSHSYWSAGVQALLKNVRSIQEDPKKGAAILGIAGVSAAVGIGSVFFNGGDDDDIALMANMPVEFFSKNTFFFDKDLGGWCKIRTPEILAPVTAAAQMATFATLYQVYKSKPSNYSMDDYANAMFKETLPGGFRQLEMGAEGILTRNGDKTAEAGMQMLPQLTGPALHTALNIKSWPTITPIVTGKYSKLEPQYQFNKYSSEFSKWMGSQFNNISPMKVDYFIKAQFGSNARFILETTAEESRNIMQSPFSYSGTRTWLRGKEYATFLQQSAAIEKHKNSISPMLSSMGVDVSQIMDKFNDTHLTPGDFVKNDVFKYLKSINPVAAEEVRKSYEAFRRSEMVTDLTYVVSNANENDILPDGIKLEYYDMLYNFNRNTERQDYIIESVAQKLKDTKKLTGEDLNTVNKILNKIKSKKR